jgi:transcriptional regulator with XRE-family HTH domain
MTEQADDDLLRDVGRRLAEVRAERGWTQEEFADAGGFTVRYVQRVERGLENLTLRSLARLSRLLGVGVVDIFSAPATRAVRPGRPPAARPSKRQR